MPEILEKRVQDLSEKLSSLDSESEGLSVLEINEFIRGKNFWGNNMAYSSEELTILFDFYREMIVEINRVKKYPPTKENFCAFAGISTQVYNQYLSNVVDENKSEIMQQIDDYIRDNMITAAQLGELREVTSIFRGKASHGMVEAAAPVVIRRENSVGIDKINKLIEQIEGNGTIHVVKNLEKKNGIYE